MQADFWTAEARALADALGFDVALNPHAGKPDEATWAGMLRGVDALMTTWGAPRLTAGVLAGADALRIVGHAAGSAAELVSPELFRRGIRLVTANPVMAQSVAEWALMMTLVGRRHLLDYAQFGTSRPLVWERREQAFDLAGATVAVWGWGDVAQRLVRMLKPVGPARILVCDDFLTPAAAAAAAGAEKVAFDRLFREGDTIHLLAALTEKNLGRVGAAELAAIRDGAVLINCGRADVVQEAALLAELRKNRFTAILDVHFAEPPAADDPIRNLPNVILTPHCAGASTRLDRYVLHVLREFDRFFAGKPLESEIGAERAVNMTRAALVGHGRRNA
jgi:phosphoglycerate dehydrogenase-like enzyme